MDSIAKTFATALHEAVIDYYDEGPQIFSKERRHDEAMLLLRIAQKATGRSIKEIASAARFYGAEQFATWLNGNES